MRNHWRRLTAICFGVALGLAFAASAQIFSPLHIFSTASGSTAPLIQGPDGTLYGVSALGGASGPPASGTVFKVQPDGSGFGIIYSFTNGSDGAGPAAGLALSGNTLYGTTKNGGTGAHGTIFKVNTDGSSFTTIYSFTAYTSSTNSDGANPLGTLVLSGSTLYGTTSAGGVANGFGSIFKVNTDGSGFSTLHLFGVSGVSDPAHPMAGLVLSGSTLYGTTYGGGGAGAGGIVFKMDTSGTGFTALHTFSPTVSGTNADGAHPEADLVLSGGILYGTTSDGGAGDGSVFSLNPGDSSFTNLYSFTNGVDGSTPIAALAVSGGSLYGTTSAGGTNFPGWGTVFKLNTDGTGFTNLYEFAQGLGGTQPAAGLLLSGSTLYGTTQHTSGGAGGTIFKLGTNGSGFTVIASGSDGAMPQGGLVLSGDSFYGTTSAGGSPGAGIVFKVKTNGTGFTTLHTFTVATNQSVPANNNYANSDGAMPVGTLAVSGGVLYGTAEIGGTYGVGTIFRLNTDGTGFTNLYNFTNGVDGAYPAAGMALAGNSLYGTASGSQALPNDSAGQYSSIFKINTDGTGFTNLYDFSPLSFSTNSDGSSPLSGLVVGGNFLYGTTYYGGPGGAGTIFKINTNGTAFTTLYFFNTVVRNSSNSVDGANPEGTLVLSGNTLYGTASSGGVVTGNKGVGGPGTVFQLNTGGTGFVKLYTFTNSFGGSAPKTGLVLSGGTLYGTSSLGGNGTAGTVFQLDISGTGFATLHTFPFQQGTPLGDLAVVGNTVYGTCEFGAPVSASSLAGAGAVFAVTPTATPSIHFTASPTNGIPPTAVQFTSPSVDDNGNPIISWNWNFGDGSTNTSQNPLHAYTNNGPFAPALVAVNNNGATIIGSGPTIAVIYPSSILNGGFEAGTFTNWTGSGNYGLAAVTPAANYRHSGTYGAQLYANSTLGFLSQTLSTTPGTVYSISFWMRNPTSITNNEFRVSWNGNMLLDMTNLPVTGWTNIQLMVTATAGVSVLQFGYRNDTAYFGLDDVSVSSVQPLGIAGITLSGTDLLVNGTGGLSGRTYYVLMGTNLAEPLNQWAPVATNVPGADGNFSFTATNAVDRNVPRRFYMLQLQ
jgi:uncharacterized repeat protein (TIGR03803 family)